MSENKNKITMYTQKGCAYCDNIKEEFTKAEIKFVEKDTEKNRENWLDIIRFTGIPMTPTIIYKDEYMVPGRDFASSKHLIELISDIKVSKFSTNKQIDQKIRTLNYNMGMAFGRTDKILREIEIHLNEVKENNKNK